MVVLLTHEVCDLPAPTWLQANTNSRLNPVYSRGVTLKVGTGNGKWEMANEEMGTTAHETRLSPTHILTVASTLHRVSAWELQTPQSYHEYIAAGKCRSFKDLESSWPPKDLDLLCTALTLVSCPDYIDTANTQGHYWSNLQQNCIVIVM